MERDPLTRQRSEWHNVSDAVVVGPIIELLEANGSTDVAVFVRRVGDGLLEVFRARELGGLHLSICWKPQSERQRSVRYPTWDEIADARDTFLPAEIEFVMFLPRAGEYVAAHSTTFHLHECPENVHERDELARLNARVAELEAASS